MKEYHLNRLNENVRAFSIILIMPLFLGVIAVANAWNNPFWKTTGLILVIFSLLGIIISYFNIYKSYIIKIDNNTVTISNKKGTKEKKYNINDIALIQHNESINNIEAYTSKKPIRENILIFSKTGKGIFVCSNSHNQTEFDKFFIDITNRINAKEKLIYDKQIRLTRMYRSLYINPLYEGSKLVKKKTRQSGFWYPIIFFISAIIIFITIFQLWCIFSTPFNPTRHIFKYEDISFQHEYYWQIKTDVITKGKTYYIDCSNNQEIIAITVSKEIYEDIFLWALENIEYTEPKSEIKAIKTGKFGNYDCVFANYSYCVDGKTFYAAIYAFNANNKSISIVKQSDRFAGLRHDFKLIEETFQVK